MADDKPTTPNGDQRVTNATIALKIDHINERLDEFLNKVRDVEDCQKTDHDKITRLESKYDVWSGINSALAFIAGAIGSLVK